MDSSALINFIRSNIPNIAVNETSLVQIKECFEELNLEKGEYLLKQGKVSGYYILIEGCLRAYTFNEEGEEITTYFYSSNRVVFEAASFFQRIPSTENIIAIAPSQGFITSFEKLNEMFHVLPEFREFGRAMLVKEFVAYKQRTLAMINTSAEERYTALIQSNEDIFLHAQLKHIASYLGITDTSLSRIRRDFSKRKPGFFPAK